MKKLVIYLLLGATLLLGSVFLFAFRGEIYSSIMESQEASKVEVGNESIQKWKGLVFAPKYKKGSAEFLKDFELLVTEALSPMGINLIVFDMHWSNYNFTSIPGLKPLGKQSFGVVSAIDAKKISDICKENNIKVVVGMNFLTHQSYGQLLKSFPEYQWPGNEKLWDPLNPEVNNIAFKMADELITAFDAEVFHVGLDEGWGFDVEKHPKAKGYTTAELFAKAVTEYHHHFVEEKGVQMMMWTDMLEGRYADAPVADAISMIPKDITLVSWDYDCHWKRYPGLGELVEKVIPVCPWESKWPIEFAEKGFNVMVSPWKNPRAAEGLANATDQIKKSQFEGILYTTWSADVVPDLRDALLGNETKRKLDPTIIGVAKSMKRTIDAGALND